MCVCCSKGSNWNCHLSHHPKSRIRSHETPRAVVKTCEMRLLISNHLRGGTPSNPPSRVSFGPRSRPVRSKRGDSPRNPVAALQNLAALRGVGVRASVWTAVTEQGVVTALRREGGRYLRASGPPRTIPKRRLPQKPRRRTPEPGGQRWRAVLSPASWTAVAGQRLGLSLTPKS